MLKILVGTAAVAVIAAVGYYFMQEYDAYSVRTAARDFQNRCEALLYSASVRPWTDDDFRAVGECEAAGRLTDSQVKEAMSTMLPPKFTFQHLGDPSTKPELK